MGSDAFALFDDLVSRIGDRGTDKYRTPSVERADTGGDLVRVAESVLDIVSIDAKLAGEHLLEGSAVALAMVLALVRELLSKSRKIFKVSKILRMGLPIVENLSGLSGNIFSLSRIAQLHFN